MQNKHIGNNQSEAMRQYKAVVALKNLNEAADRIEINYDNLDTLTAGEIKQTIANTLHGFMNIESIPEETKKYIDSLIRQNMTYKIDIDYSKIDNEEVCTAFILKKNINQKLDDRKHSLYLNLTLNANY